MSSCQLMFLGVRSSLEAGFGQSPTAQLGCIVGLFPSRRLVGSNQSKFGSSSLICFRNALHSTGLTLGSPSGEWFALETNRDHSIVFEIASKYCILNSFVDHDGYSISSVNPSDTIFILFIWMLAPSRRVWGRPRGQVGGTLEARGASQSETSRMESISKADQA